MKKAIFYIILGGTLFVACQKAEPTNENEIHVQAKASVESAQTKAALNSSYELLWKTGDFIDIYFKDWGKKEQAFYLSGGDGTTSATFTRQDSGEFTWDQATCALFPYANGNNIYNSTAYFKLLDSYSGYTSGQSITPLIANMDGTDNIKFKYVGGAIQITLNKIPKDVNGISLTCDKGITGEYNVPCNKAGLSDGILSLDSGKQAESFVKYSFTKLTAESTNMTFIFPVPTINSVKFVIDLYKDDAIVWSQATAAAQATDGIGRKDILVMPSIDVETVSSTTKTIYVGYISYFNENDASSLKVHYWGSGDDNADLTKVGVSELKVAGAGYWSGASQTFHLYKATVPIGITGFELKWGGTKKGGEASSSTTRAYIFNYDGDKVIFK